MVFRGAVIRAVLTTVTFWKFYATLSSLSRYLLTFCTSSGRASPQNVSVPSWYMCDLHLSDRRIENMPLLLL